MDKEQERDRLARVALNRADAAPVAQALRAAGFPIDTIADLYNKKMNYITAIPILIDWLPRVSNPAVKEDIVRSLSVVWAQRTEASRLLAREFELAEDSTGLGVRWAIGNALEVLANDDIADQMIMFAKDPRYGIARQMVVLGLGKLHDQRVTEVLLGLLEDDEVVGHAVMALGKIRAKSARSQIECLLKHPKPWVRKEAKKALARLDKAE